MSRQSTGSEARPRALFLSPEAPYPPVGGGALRAASLVEYLGRRYELDVIVFREPGAADPAASIPAGLARAVHVIPLPHHARNTLARAARSVRRMLRSRPPLNDRFGGFGDTIRGFLDGRRYDVAVLEHFWSAPYWEQVAPRAGRVVLDLHNIESVLMGGCAEAEARPVSMMFRRFETACARMEREWLPRFNLLLASSESDAARLREMTPGTRIECVPNTIPFVPRPSVPEEETIVFSGNLEYRPNLTAVRFFREEVWPLLRERRPQLVWRIVGKNPRAVRGLVAGDARIDLVGPVSDAIAVLARAKVAVIPVLAGSGTRVKILEAWAAGRAVVSTTLGAEGLNAEDGKHLLIADGAERFAGAVSSLLESETSRHCLGNAGRKLFEANFTWESAWERLAEAGI